MKTKKVAITKSHGGFHLSKKAKDRLNEIGYKVCDCESKIIYSYCIERENPLLIQVIEELGEEAGNKCKLKIVEIPYDVDYIISEYDGMEVIEEKHRSWS